MAPITTIEEVPSLTLAFLAGRWIAIAQIECNAGSGREHAVENHAAAAAVAYILGSRGASIATADISAAVDSLGNMIRAEFHGAQTEAHYPPRAEVIAEIIRCANESLTA